MITRRSFCAATAISTLALGTGLQKEMRLAERFQCPTIVTGGKGPIGLSGDELKQAVRRFVEQMKPHLAVAEETGEIRRLGGNLYAPVSARNIDSRYRRRRDQRDQPFA